MSVETSIGLLHTVSDPVNMVEENLELYFKQLESEIQQHENGVGLAGVQIGILKRVAIIRSNTKDNSKIIRLWNPEIVSQEGEKIVGEGCLSLPGFSKSVARPLEVVFRNGDGRTFVLFDWEAQIFSHEYDHLNGITIFDKELRVEKVGRNSPCPCGKRDTNGHIIKYKRCCGR